MREQGKRLFAYLADVFESVAESVGETHEPCFFLEMALGTDRDRARRNIIALLRDVADVIENDYSIVRNQSVAYHCNKTIIASWKIKDPRRLLGMVAKRERLADVSDEMAVKDADKAAAIAFANETFNHGAKSRKYWADFTRRYQDRQRIDCERTPFSSRSKKRLKRPTLEELAAFSQEDLEQQVDDRLLALLNSHETATWLEVCDLIALTSERTARIYTDRWKNRYLYRPKKYKSGQSVIGSQSTGTPAV